MTDTKIDPRPDYLTPVPLAEAIDAGLDLTVMDESIVGSIVGGNYNTALWRAQVSAALTGDPGCCVPMRDDSESEYVLRWPPQETIDVWQWEADLADNPELLPMVLERFTDEQRAGVQFIVDLLRQSDAAKAAVDAATDEEIFEAARDLAVWALTKADQPGREVLRCLGSQIADGASDHAVKQLRAFFVDPGVFS